MGRTFKKSVKSVISNDLEDYSYMLNRNYIQNHLHIPNKELLLKELNALPLVNDGFIYQNYCLGSGSGRQYFSDENGQKIDSIRQKLNEWRSSDRIDENTYYFLLASLLESADKVANTASVYGAFLKHLKKSAAQSIKLKPANFIKTKSSHKVFKCDANELIKQINGDILYLDPPYNIRQYGANYHLLNTITLYDKFIPQGKTRLRGYNRSSYCKKNEVARSFEELIQNAQFEYIFLSYNNEGLMSEEQVKAIMQKYGSYSLATKEYQRFKADNSRTQKATSTFEYLHVVKKF